MFSLLLCRFAISKFLYRSGIDLRELEYNKTNNVLNLADAINGVPPCLTQCAAQLANLPYCR